MAKRFKGLVCILEGEDYKPGDPAPIGYLEWHEWADVQIKAGLKQQQCGKCSKWFFPQELSDKTIETNARTAKGARVRLSDPVCIGCVKGEPR